MAKRMCTWRKAWREYIVPLLSTAGLEALRLALLRDDPRLIRGETAKEVYDETLLGGRGVAGACAVGYAGWQGDGLRGVVAVMVYFEDLDRALRKSPDDLDGTHLDDFVEWFDGQIPFDVRERKRIFRQLLPEVSRELARRLGQPFEEPAAEEAVA